ncbi:patatin-like phospholipase family protein [Bradyrhizobium sp. OHSU_III]|jgi:NTE family protein|uniref:patatin-like phospholipase family protein n=1 Tax=Bradyrhizobium TaxID=374 RepID=UPI0031B8742D
MPVTTDAALEPASRLSGGGPQPGGRKSINLALQGGGSHGAFTWGVLDRLLEDDRIKIDGISGTSAGAMNGAVLAYGMMEGGAGRAREMLERFWQAVAEKARSSLFQPSWFDQAIAPGNLAFFRGISGFRFHDEDVFPLRHEPARSSSNSRDS